MEDSDLCDVCAMLVACDSGQLRTNMRRVVEERAKAVVPACPPRADTGCEPQRFGVAAVDQTEDPGDAADAFDDFEDQYARKGARGLVAHKKGILPIEIFAWLVAVLDCRADRSVLVVTAPRFAVIARRSATGARVLVYLGRDGRVLGYDVQSEAHAAWLRRNLEKQPRGDSWIIIDEFEQRGRPDSALVGAPPAH